MFTCLQIEGVDMENSRVIVKMSLSGDKVTLSQFAVKLVTDEEYKKYSKYLSELFCAFVIISSDSVNKILKFLENFKVLRKFALIIETVGDRTKWTKIWDYIALSILCYWQINKY